MSRLSIELPEALHRAIKAEASLRGMSLRDYVLHRLNAPETLEETASAKRFSDAGLAGLWSDRDDMGDSENWVRKQRQGRAFGLPPDVD
jgi:hypothetical protein